MTRTLKNQPFEVVRLVGTERRVGPSLASVSRHWKQEKECFLFVSPHDDDVVIGGALLILAALKMKVPVHVAIVTDGRMGYCTDEQKDSIVDIRREETYASLRSLGVKKRNIHFLGFPDCQLSDFRGRRAARQGDPAVIEGFTGMQNAFTSLLRKVQPNQVFLPTNSDLHPDHRYVHSELMISCFHAAGEIWPELGKPLPRLPYVHEMAVYCNFPSPPKLRIQASLKAFQKKLDAIRLFKSQKQISTLVKHVEQSGPWEYLRPVEFALYNPAVYRDMFEEAPQFHHLYE